MSRRRSRLGHWPFILGLALLLGPAPGWAKDAELKPRLEGAGLIQALQRGGYVLYVRHATSDRLQEDSDLSNLDDCSKQRNLTGQGRAEARSIGEMFSQLRIPVSDVHSSPYCRTVETGTLAFGQATKTPDLIYSLGLEPAQRSRLATALKQMLAYRASTREERGAGRTHVQSEGSLGDLAEERGRLRHFSTRRPRGFFVRGTDDRGGLGSRRERARRRFRLLSPLRDDAHGSAWLGRVGGTARRDEDSHAIHVGAGDERGAPRAPGRAVCAHRGGASALADPIL